MCIEVSNNTKNFLLTSSFSLSSSTLSSLEKLCYFFSTSDVSSTGSGVETLSQSLCCWSIRWWNVQHGVGCQNTSEIQILLQVRIMVICSGLGHLLVAISSIIPGMLYIVGNEFRAADNVNCIMIMNYWLPSKINVPLQLHCLLLIEHTLPPINSFVPLEAICDPFASSSI